MNVEIEKKLQHAVSEHKNGNINIAENIYREVLKFDSSNLIANGNLGSILIYKHKSENGIPFLKIAFENKCDSEVYWFNYVDALINSGKFDEAHEIIERGKKVGFPNQNFEVLIERTLTPSQVHAKGKLYRALDGYYINFLRALHEKVYEGYFEIGTRFGDTLVLSQSPTIAIDPYFQLKKNPIFNKDSCLLFQETSDSFFKNTMPKLSHYKCQLAFIDGMHLFEYALRDFINLAKISTKDVLFLFHDPIPWTFKMTIRDNKKLRNDENWVGDIWKLVPIFIDAGLKNSLNLLSSAPSGILAVLNPDKKIISQLEKNYENICAKWINVEFSKDNLSNFYNSDIFTKPEIYLKSLEKISFGNKIEKLTKEWISQ